MQMMLRTADCPDRADHSSARDDAALLAALPTCHRRRGIPECASLAVWRASWKQIKMSRNGATGSRPCLEGHGRLLSSNVVQSAVYVHIVLQQWLVCCLDSQAVRLCLSWCCGSLAMGSTGHRSTVCVSPGDTISFVSRAGILEEMVCQW